MYLCLICNVGKYIISWLDSIIKPKRIDYVIKEESKPNYKAGANRANHRTAVVSVQEWFSFSEIKGCSFSRRGNCEDKWWTKRTLYQSLEFI